LHNPANLEGIIIAEEIFNKAEQVAVLILLFIKLFHKLLINLLIQMRCMTITKYDWFSWVINTFQKKAIDYLEKVQNNQYPFGQWL
jgi:hypothetical protein